MIGFRKANSARFLVGAAGVIGLFAGEALGQYGGGSPGPTPGGGTSSPGAKGAPGAGPYQFRGNYHMSFDRPEAWGLKYFASTTLLSGLPPPAPLEGYHAGSVTLGVETAWLPTLDAGQQRIGFNGTKPEDLNKAPVLVRPVVRVGLPDKFTLIAAGPPPFHVFGVTPRLFAFGVERPIVERESWMLGWRGYGQVGSVKGAFTCPRSVVVFAPGSAGNPAACVAESSDVATLRYAGSELQLSYRIPSAPKLVPHVSAGANLIDGVFQVHAPLEVGIDQTRLWTRGATFSATAGVTYSVTKRAALSVDAFYSPLWVRRVAGGPPTNDGLFNVRALLSYTLR